MDQLTYTGTLEIQRCPTCQIPHAIPTEMKQRMLDRRGPSGRQAYCPNGHTWHFIGKTNAEEEREARQRAERRLAYEQSRRDQAEAAAREERERTAAMRAEVTRTRRRAVAGACPSCNRSFVQLQKHMAAKHPDYLGAPEMPADISRWSLVSAVAEAVGRADEPLTPEMVHGRLVLAGRRYDTIAKVRGALYNAERTRGLKRVAPCTWASA